MSTETAAPAVKARRGDLVVVHTRSTDHSHGSRVGPVTTDEWDIGLVTSVTREGLVKRWRRCDDLDPASKGSGPDLARRAGVQGWQLVPQASIDTAGALATAACHTWPGHEMTRRYSSLEEVRAALRPHLREAPRSAELAAAAETWRQARREASTRYRSAREGANRAHAQAGYHTREGDAQRTAADREAGEAFRLAVEAANTAYRAALEA